MRGDNRVGLRGGGRRIDVGGGLGHVHPRNDPGARDPFVPVKADKQREALKFLQEHVLSEQHFRFSPRLLRHLGADR